MLFYALYVIAVTAEAMTAALSAGRRSMDWVGVCVIGFVTALGGGSVRDVLLGHYPLSWVKNPSLIAITVIAALATMLAAPIMRHLRSLFLVLDALGLVVFTIIGCQVALEMGLSPLVVLMSGMITGCAGGVMRDVLCNEIPLLFRRELYASVSVLTGLLYLGMMHIDIARGWAVIGAMTFGLLLRLLAIRLNWHMPKFVYKDDWH